jgi:hypothetical protein
MNKKFLVIGIVVIVLVAAFATVALMLSEGGTTSVPERANFVVTSFSIDRHDVLVNQTVNVAVVTKNNGTAEGSHQFNLTVDGAEVNSSTVHLGIGEETSIGFTISSAVVGNHTLAVGTNTTYLNCYHRNIIGDFLYYRITGHTVLLGSINGSMTIRLVAANSTSGTLNVSYSGINIPDSQYTGNLSDNWSTGLQDLKFVGMVNVRTSYGMKTLSNYTYIRDSGLDYGDVLVDASTGVEFQIDSTYSPSTYLIYTLVDTNMPWVAEIGE